MVGYDPFADRYFDAKATSESGITAIDFELESMKSVIFIRDMETDKIESKISMPQNRTKLENFETSICRAIDYPNFVKKDVDEDFSGFIHYEKKLELTDMSRAILVIEDAYEGVEVFINGHSLGIQVVPAFYYDLTDYLITGMKQIVIEVASTLQRERRKDPDMAAVYFGQKFVPADPDPIGITGDVFLYYA